MDSPPHGQRERIQHALLAGHRRHASDCARRLARPGRQQPPRERGGARSRRWAARLSAAEAAFQAEARRLYEERIELGVAREQARKDLPLSTYTEAYWKVDLHNLLHFLALRMDHHAQEEIRLYARAIGEQIVRPLFPLVWEAFVDYRLEGMFLSRLEREVITPARPAAGPVEPRPRQPGRFSGRARSELGRPWPARASGTNAAKNWSDWGCWPIRSSGADADSVSQEVVPGNARELAVARCRLAVKQRIAMTDSTTGELLAMNQQLLDAIAHGDWETYQQLCDPTLTAFEPEAQGQLVEGLDFHKFYFDLGADPGPRHTTMASPHVRLMGDTALVAYVRLVQSLDAAGNPRISQHEETRIWQRREGRWRHVHFHRSTS